ncbi:MAG: photosystem II reaction center protein PsbN [Calothrix sp. C42_A2020_038]|nr:photosystem II reaction center protein PsbN [Calothrix sp. C42_A2020_038]
MEFATSLSNLEPATVMILAVSAVVIIITGASIYTSFGPPSKELADPFDDHED